MWLFFLCVVKLMGMCPVLKISPVSDKLKLKVMKTKSLRDALLLALLIFAFSGCVVPLETSTSKVGVRVQYNNPDWAPVYYSGVRYYYFPDIEVYYDLSNADYIYLYNGQWVFSRYLPPFYSNYNLRNSFVISLNVNIYQPWRHHHYYISHYPRYYYKNYYKNDYNRMRGFNENERKPIYRDGDNGRRPDYRNDNNDRGVRDNKITPKEGRGSVRPSVQEQQSTPTTTPRGSRYQTPTPTAPKSEGEATTPRTSRYDNNATQTPQPKVEPSTPSTPRSSGESEGRGSSYSREPQDPNYYGKTIGKPVKVERQMRETKAPEKKTESEGRSSGGRR